MIVIRVYWDSNVLISFFLHDQFYEYAKEQIERVYEFEKGRDLILISHMVLLEMIEVLRKRIVEKETLDSNFSYIGYWTHGVAKPDKIKNENVERKASVLIQEAMELIQQLQNEGLLLIVSPDKPIKNYHIGILSVYQKTFGTMKIERICKKCKNVICLPDYNFKSIGHLDIFHGLVACEFESNEIVTFDSYFPRIKHLGIPQFTHLAVNVPYFN